MALVLVRLLLFLPRYPSRRDSWSCSSVHPAVLCIAFFGGYRAIVVVVYLLSIPSLYLVELAISRTVNLA